MVNLTHKVVKAKMYNIKINLRGFIVFITFVYKNQTIVCSISKNVVTIKDSWIIRKVTDMKAIIARIRLFAEKRGFIYKRTNTAWLREWKAHNLLYNIGFKRSSTVNTDFSEKESAFRRFCYFLLSSVYIA